MAANGDTNGAAVNGDYVPRLKQLYNDELRAKLQTDLTCRR